MSKLEKGTTYLLKVLYIILSTKTSDGFCTNQNHYWKLSTMWNDKNLSQKMKLKTIEMHHN